MTKRGKLLQNGEEKFSNVLFQIQRTQDPHGGLRGWHGHFTFHLRSNEDCITLFEMEQADEPVQLILDDGQQGLVNIRKSNRNGHTATVSFVGNGPLK